MNAEFVPIKSERVYQKVVEQIKKLVIDGKLQRGDKLPSERELAKLLGVSRASIRQAFSALEIIGVIESHPGDGTFITRQPSSTVIEPLSILFLLENRHNMDEQLLEVRQILEVSCAGIAAQKARTEDIESIGHQVRLMQQYLGDEYLSFLADKEFHHCIARATDNALLAIILNTIAEAMDLHIKDSRRKLLKDQDSAAQLCFQHEQIYRCIKEHDADRAREWMRIHLESIKEGFIKTILV